MLCSLCALQHFLMYQKVIVLIHTRYLFYLFTCSCWDLHHIHHHNINMIIAIHLELVLSRAKFKYNLYRAKHLTISRVFLYNRNIGLQFVFVALTVHPCLKKIRVDLKLLHVCMTWLCYKVFISLVAC